MGELTAVTRNSAGVADWLAKLLALPTGHVRNRLMHPHLGLKVKDGDRPRSGFKGNGAVGSPMRSQPRRNPPDIQGFDQLPSLPSVIAAYRAA